MPPKGSRRRAPAATATGTSTPNPVTETSTPLPLSGTVTPTPTSSNQQPSGTTLGLAESLSYLHEPRPFKNPHYTKGHNRRAKTLKQVLNGERERVKLERERLRLVQEAEAEANKEEDEGAMDVDKQPISMPIMSQEERRMVEEDTFYASTEAAPSFRPHPHYCDITGLEGPYTDPRTMLRYHDKDVYEIVRGLNVSAARDYLALRGVMPVVK